MCPNYDDFLDPKVASHFKQNFEEATQMAITWTQKYALK